MLEGVKSLPVDWSMWRHVASIVYRRF